MKLLTVEECKEILEPKLEATYKLSVEDREAIEKYYEVRDDNIINMVEAMSRLNVDMASQRDEAESEAQRYCWKLMGKDEERTIIADLDLGPH